MDRDKIKRRQSLKVIISEAIMVLAVIAMVSVLALIVSGYWLNSDFEVERQGMVQVSSTPTGADLDIDGTSSWLQRTNTSRVVSSGEHTITISKEGYDSWSKTINVSEGLLYRLHYPRLFLQDRTAENVLDVKGATFASVSPDHDKLLLIGDTTEWQIINLKDDTLKPKKINLAKYLPSVSLAENANTGLFAGKILTADWDRDNRHILLKIQDEGTFEWVLVDVENPSSSLNVSKEFGANFDAIEILDNSSSNLLAIQNGNLHKIDVPGKLISAILAENVIDYDHYENEIVFVSKNEAKYSINLFKLGDNETTKLKTFSEPLKVVLSKFYDEMYITTLQNNQLSLYKKVDFNHIQDYELSFSPDNIKVGHNGEFIAMHSGNQLATLDMETYSVREWHTDGENFGWLDNDMVYSVAQGELFVYDFDGLNRRMLAKNVSSYFPVTITDNKWLYYFSDGSLVRELITS